MTQAEMQMIDRLVKVLRILCKGKEDEVAAYLTYILTGK